MRKLLILSALLLASASARAQSVDINSLMSGNGVDQQQIGSMMEGGGMGGAGMGGAGAGGGRKASKRRSASQQQQQQQQQQQSGKGGTRESSAETRARNIASKYGVSW